MYCTNCGKHNPKGSKFCQHCGIKLSHSARSTVIQKNSETFPVESTKTKKRTTKITAWIVSILIVIILALIIWITNIYHLEVDKIISTMQGLIAPTRSITESRWIQFNDPHGRFSAYLPSEPEVDKYTFIVQGQSMSGYLYTSTIDDSDSVSIRYFKDPLTMYDSTPGDTLDSAVDSFLLNNNALVSYYEDDTFLNYPSAEFNATKKEGKKTIYIKGLIFIKGEDIYTLSEYDTTGEFAEFEKLRNYFDLN
jgi:hypothetical protein